MYTDQHVFILELRFTYNPAPTSGLPPTLSLSCIPSLHRKPQGLEAYGIFKIGEIIGRRNLVGYKLQE